MIDLAVVMLAAAASLAGAVLNKIMPSGVGITGTTVLFTELLSRVYGSCCASGNTEGPWC